VNVYRTTLNKGGNFDIMMC